MKIKKSISKLFGVTILTLFCLNISNAQTINKEVYNPSADAQKELNAAIIKAGTESKNIFVDVGGNWCVWCIRFYNYCKEDMEIDSIISHSYIELLINHSPENENMKVLKKLGEPNKLGFPVFLIVDKSGTVLVTQDSGYFYIDKGWNRERILEFFTKWVK